MADRIIMPVALDANGSIVAGAKATFFETGTSTPLEVYSDAAGTAPVAVPLLADASGRFPATFATQAVKLIITDTSDVNLPDFPSDPHYLTPASNATASGTAFTPITGNSATTVQGAIQTITTLWNAVTTFGKSLIAASDATAARTVLGIGAATETAAGLVEAATTAEGTTGTATDKFPPVAVVQSMIDGSSNRVWVNFNGQGTPAVVAGSGIDSITDNGVGDYTINFSDALANANYAVLGSCSGFGAGGTNNRAIFQVATDGSGPITKTTSALRIYTANTTGALVDPFEVSVEIVGG